LTYARRLGYKIVFDIVEDDDYAMRISRTVSHRIKTLLTQYLIRRIRTLASGIIVISTHLHQKYAKLTSSAVPLHLLPISIDSGRHQPKAKCFSDSPTLFYSGSFGQKDGVSVLLEAFELMAAEHKRIRLVLTGKGSEEAMRPILKQIDSSPYKNRIDYKGYLDEKDYYSILNTVDIPCMTRTDTAYAQAGFPFKLGEFLATGKAVIASRVSDVDSLLQNKKNAILVTPGSSDAIVNAVKYLLSHPEESRGIGQAGKEVAEAQFDFRKQGIELLAYLRNI